MLTTIPLCASGHKLTARCAAALAHAEHWLRYPPAKALEKRANTNRRGTPLHLLVQQRCPKPAAVGHTGADKDAGSVLGFTGWLAYPPDPYVVQSTTYLTTSTHGSGVNVQTKMLLWQVAQCADVPLIASVHEDNGRSLAAVRKLWPDATARRCYEEHKSRWAVVTDLTDPPRNGRPWPQTLVEHYAATVRQILLAVADGR